MTTTIKSTIAFCGFLAAVSAPLTARTDNFVFSGKGAFGDIYGYHENGDMQVLAFETATSSKSNKTNSSGAEFIGYIYTDTECWSGYGFTDTIQFNVIGSLLNPKRVTASGKIPVTWVEYCNSNTPFTEIVSFTMDLSAIKNQAYKAWGTGHSEYGNAAKVNTNYNYSSAPAALNASSISSQFGIVTPSFGSVGHSKGHDVQIIR